MPKKILPKEIFRGRRTGVKLKVAPNTKTTTNNNNKNSKTGIEDINTFWDNIQTSDTPSPKTASSKKARNNKLNEEKNISYPESIINTKSKNNDEKKKPSRAVLAMIEKLHNDDNDTTATNDFLSPSNLSRVSTAPPSASSKDVDDDDMVLSDNDNINNSMVEDEEEDLFPMANNNDDNEEEEHVLKHGSSKLSTSPSISTREDEQQQQSSSNNTKNSLASSTSDMIVVDGQESIHLEENAVDFLNNTSGYSSNTPESRKSSVMDNKDKLITQQDYEEESLNFSSSPSPSSYNSRKKISVYSEEDYSKQQPSASSPPASSPPAFSPPASSPSSSRITKESTMLNNTSPSSFSQEEHNINSSLPGNDKSISTATSSKISKHSSSGDDTVDRSHDVMKQKLSSPASLKTSVTTPSQQKSNPEDDDDLQFSDDDKEGPGFSMAHPEGEEEEEEDEERALPSKSKDKSKSKKKKKNEAPSKKRKYVTPSPSARRVTWSTGYQVDNRGYELQPISSYHTDSPQRDDDETPNGMRRSRRAKMKPLQFWKNERLVYSKGGGERIPVVTGVLTALPTPYKKRKRDESSSTDDDERTSKTSKKHDKVTHYGSENIPTYDDTKLRKKNFIMEKDTDTALVLDAPTYEIVSKKLVAYSSKLPSTQLPITGARDKKESKIVGKAAQAFNLPPSTSKDKNVSQLPGWISGHLHLPPKGIKDAEGVGNCAQVFFIQHCQPNSLEVAYGDPEEDEFQIETAQRILLNPGDFFYIPPSNVYRIENHSKEYESKLAWTIIRPFS